MAKNKKLQRVAEKQASSTDTAVNVTLKEASLLGVGKVERDERPYVNLKYYHSDYECFSSWDSDKLRAFSEFCRKLGGVKWTQIYQTGGSLGHKTGFGYTVHKNPKFLDGKPHLKEISPDLTWFELRVDQESRVHGFRVGEAFFLVLLDIDHRIYP